MKATWSVCLLLICMNSVFAETFIRDYTYIASEMDSKITSRINALDQVKVILLQEIGIHIQKSITIKKDSTGSSEAFEDIKAITAGLTKVEILDEKWNGDSFFIQVKIEADPVQVLDALEHFKNQKPRENTTLLSKLKLNQTELESARNDIDDLKKKLSKVDSSHEKNSIAMRYNEQVDKINFQSGVISCGDVIQTPSLSIKKALHANAQKRAQENVEKLVGKKLINPYIGIVRPKNLESTLRIIEVYWCESITMPLHSV